MVRFDDIIAGCDEDSVGRDCASCSPSFVVFEDMMSLNSPDVEAERELIRA